MDRQDLYRLFSEFVAKSRGDIKSHIVESLQFVNDRPSLLISCLNEYIELLHSEAFPVELQWTKLFRTFYDIQSIKDRARWSGDAQSVQFADFISDYSYHSVFMECFESISKTVCRSLATDFELLFAKLSTRSHTEDDSKEEEQGLNAAETHETLESEKSDVLKSGKLETHETLKSSACQP